MRSSKSSFAAANTMSRNIARPIADEGHDLALDRAALFLKGEDVGENLARMLVIRQRVDRRRPAKSANSSTSSARKCG